MHLLSNIPAVTYAWKALGEQSGVFVSENVASIFGYESTDFLRDQRIWIDRIHLSDLPRVLVALSQLYEHDRQAVEYRFLHKNGEYRWVHDEMRLIRDERGAPVQVVGCWVDISEWRSAEEALRERVQTLSSLMDNLPGMAYRRANNSNWTMEFVSSGCVELTGYEPSDLQQDSAVSYVELIHPEDRERVWSEIQRALEERSPYQLRYRIVTASGPEKWVREQGHGLWSPEGELIALEGFIMEEVANNHSGGGETAQGSL